MPALISPTQPLAGILFHWSRDMTFFVPFAPQNVNYKTANMTKNNLKTLRSVGPSGLPRAALEKFRVGQFWLNSTQNHKSQEKS